MKEGDDLKSPNNGTRAGRAGHGDDDMGMLFGIWKGPGKLMRRCVEGEGWVDSE